MQGARLCNPYFCWEVLGYAAWVSPTNSPMWRGTLKAIGVAAWLCIILSIFIIFSLTLGSLNTSCHHRGQGKICVSSPDTSRKQGNDWGQEVAYFSGKGTRHLVALWCICNLEASWFSSRDNRIAFSMVGRPDFFVVQEFA